MDQPLLSSKEAGALLGYTHDYISKLCREGKMSGVQRGRVWYVTEAEARAFQVRHEAELEAKKAQLSQKFSAIRLEHESKRKGQPDIQAVDAAADTSVPEKTNETAPVIASVSDNLPGAVVGSEGDVPEPFVPAFFTSPVLAFEPSESPKPFVSAVKSEVGPQTVTSPAAQSVQAADEPAVDKKEESYEFVPAQPNEASESESGQKRVQLAFPKQFVALAVLALIVFGPSLASGLRSSANVGPLPAMPAYVADITSNLDDGVAAVIEAQSELVSKTAQTYEFAGYLNDGYWALAYTAADLGKGSYAVLNEISDAYLTVYEMQGETVLDSIQDIGRMGSTVVQGYELVGESLVVGTQNVIDSYSNFLLVDTYAENLKKK